LEENGAPLYHNAKLRAQILEFLNTVNELVPVSDMANSYDSYVNQDIGWWEVN